MSTTIVVSIRPSRAHPHAQPLVEVGIDGLFSAAQTRNCKGVNTWVVDFQVRAYAIPWVFFVLGMCARPVDGVVDNVSADVPRFCQSRA